MLVIPFQGFFFLSVFNYFLPATFGLDTWIRLTTKAKSWLYLPLQFYWPLWGAEERFLGLDDTTAVDETLHCHPALEFGDVPLKSFSLRVRAQE